MWSLPSSSLGINVGLIVAAGAAIWLAGGRLERDADTLATRLDLGKAFIGALLLAVATSLTEIATVTTATWQGNADMAVYNLLGSVVVNSLVLVLADAVSGREALSHKSAHFSLLIQGVGVVLVLAVALVGMAFRSQVSAHANAWQAGGIAAAWSALLLAAYVLSLYATYRSNDRKRWRPNKKPHEADNGGDADSASAETDDDDKEDDEEAASLGRLAWRIPLCCLVVLAAGYTVAVTADAVAEQTGLGQTFIGFTLVALVTALPEVSVTVSAARAQRLETAFANIFGSSAFSVVLLTLVAALAGGQATFESFSPGAAFAAAIGICLICVYLWGLLEREDRTLLGLGYDSVAVLALAALGLFGVYWLQ